MSQARTDDAGPGALSFFRGSSSMLKASLRLAVCFVLASTVAAALFYIDSRLVRRPQTFDTDLDRVKLVDFVRIEQSEHMVTKKRMPKKPPPPDKPPPPPKLRVASNDVAPAMQMDIDIPAIDIPMGGSGPYIGTWGRAADGQFHDGDAVPIVRIEPQYPRDALLKGLEGWVRLSFTIREDGSVCDVSVIGAEPSRVFNRNAVRAVMRWKFKPRIVDGQPVQRKGHQTIEFKLDDNLYAG